MYACFAAYWPRGLYAIAESPKALVAPDLSFADVDCDSTASMWS